MNAKRALFVLFAIVRLTSTARALPQFSPTSTYQSVEIIGEWQTPFSEKAESSAYVNFSESLSFPPWISASISTSLDLTSMVLGGSSQALKNCQSWVLFIVDFNLDESACYRLKYTFTRDGLGFGTERADLIIHLFKTSPYEIIYDVWHSLGDNVSYDNMGSQALDPGSYTLGLTLNTHSVTTKNRWIILDYFEFSILPDGGCSTPVDHKSQFGGWGLLGEPRCDEEIQNPNNPCVRKENCDYPEDGYLNQCSIWSKGCVLTCATMILNRLLGLNETPKTVNDSQWDGYKTIFDNRTPSSDGIHRIKTNDVSWPYVAELLNTFGNGSFSEQEVTTLNWDIEAVKNKIGEILCEEQVPVAVRFLKPKGGHTAVAYAVGCARDITLADPAGSSSQDLDEYLENHPGTTIQKINYIVPKNKKPRYNGGILGPASLMITDSIGRMTGFDPVTQQEYSEIPGASYMTVYPNYDFDDPNTYDSFDPNDLRKDFYIQVPAGEQLDFEIIGTGTGKAYFSLEGAGSNASLFRMEEQIFNCVPGSIDTVNVQLHMAGDFDLDDDVDIIDLKVFLEHWTQVGEHLPGDIYPPEGDNTVNLQDFVIFVSNWLAGT